MSSEVSDFCATLERAPTPGKWCAGFSACKNYAITHNIPFIAAWISDNDCSWCRRFSNASTSFTFTSWMENTDYLFWLGCSYSSAAEDKYSGSGHAWCNYNWTKGGKYPVCRIYWAVNETTRVDMFVNGGVLASPSNKTNEQATININTFSTALASYTPSTPELIQCQITFNPNGGTLVSETTRMVTQQTAIGELPVPIRSGWMFNGWYTAASDGTRISATTIITASATYYAHWTEIPDTPVTPQPDQPLKTMFGLCRDCTIITKDNKILQYSASTQRISLVGDYNPTQFLTIARNIE